MVGFLSGCCCYSCKIVVVYTVVGCWLLMSMLKSLGWDSYEISRVGILPE